MNISNYTGNIYFEGQNAGQTVTSAGKKFSNSVYFENGEYILQDVFNTTGGIFLDNGLLNFNSQNVTAQFFNSNTSNVRSLVLGNSVISITGVWNCGWTCSGWNCSQTNFAVSTGNSTINFTNGGQVNFYGGSQSYYNLIFNNGINNQGQISDGGNTFNNITFKGNGYINSSNSSFNKVSFAGDGSISGNNGVFSKITFQSNGTISGGNNSVDSLIFRKILHFR
jgi:hypothetical protein